MDVRLLQLLLGRAYGLSLTQGHHAAATQWGRGCLCRSPGLRRGVGGVWICLRVWMSGWVVVIVGGLFCTNMAFSKLKQRCNSKNNQACYLQQHCSMSNINGRGSCRELTNNLVFTQSLTWSPDLGGHRHYKRVMHSLFSIQTTNLTFLLQFLNQMFSVCSKCSRFTGFLCPRAISNVA